MSVRAHPFHIRVIIRALLRSAEVDRRPAAA
jgi:hypothetical protein